MRELSLFTGIGGGLYGSLILGWETVAYVERDEYCKAVIRQRIADGWFHQGNIYDDISSFNAASACKYRGKIDVLTAGFPCQPFSVAGKRQGASDERYFFDDIAETIQIVQPRICFFENVSGLLSDPALLHIFERLAELGYSVRPPLLLGSADCGAIHKRQRVWIYAADNLCDGMERHKPQTLFGQPFISRFQGVRSIEDIRERSDIPAPLFRGMDDEFPAWRKQLNAIGNAQDPIVMATAFQILHEVTA